MGVTADKQKRKPGRPTRAEVEARGDAPECLPKIIEYVRLGMSLRRSAEACGVCDETIRRWLNDPKCAVSLAFTQARAEREALWLAQASCDAVAARHREWLLSRTNRDEFGDEKRQVELTGADNGPVSFVFTIVDTATGGDG